MNEQRLSQSRGADYLALDAVPRTLGEALKKAVNHGIVHVRGNGEEDWQSYARLLQQAECVLGALRARGLRPGDSVILEMQNSANLLAVFWGCILGGFVPAPLHVPASFDPNSNEMVKTRNVHRLLGNPPLVTDDSLIPRFAQMPDLQVIAARDLLSHAPDARHHEAQEDEVAFLQFSSGSTGMPKGVQLTHANLRCNIASITEAGRLAGDDVFINWMPLYHDMGLIIFHLVPLYLDAKQIKLSHDTFVRKPALYLQKITEHRCTVTGSPNFGLDWMSRRVTDLSGLDLSSLRILFNGAEPISVETANTFAARLAPCGLRPEAMHYVYGMAEACVMVSCPAAHSALAHEVDRDVFVREGRFAAPRSASAPALRLADVGSPIPGMELRIVNDKDEVVPEGVVGHVQIKGPNVTSGYYQNPEANAELFCSGFLRTGDLGCMQNGRLVVTGRNKDIIFQNGQNVYAHDVEHHVQNQLGLGGQMVIAVGTHDAAQGKERVVLFLKSKKKPEDLVDIMRAARQAAATGFGLDVEGVVPLASLPKTTSGKLERYKLRTQLQAGAFDALLLEIGERMAAGGAGSGETMPRTATERRVQEIWARVLQTSEELISLDVPFFELAASSLKELALVRELEDWLGKGHVKFDTLHKHPTVGELARFADSILQGRVHGGEADSAQPGAEMIAGAPDQDAYDMAVGQRALWFIERMNPGLLTYYENYRFRIRGPLQVRALQEAIRELVGRHGVLRTVYADQDGIPKQIIGAPETPDIPYRDFSWADRREREARLERLLMEELRTPFDFEKGPLSRWRLYRMDSDEHRLEFYAHHSVTDMFSAGVMMEELSALYAAKRDGRSHELPRPVQYVDVVAWQQERMKRDEFLLTEQYWTAQLQEPLPVLELPTDRPRPPVQTFRGDVLQVPLDSELSRALRAVSAETSASMFMVLMSAYAVWLRGMTGADDLLIGVPLGGRSVPALSRVVGYLTNMMPLRVQVQGADVFEDLLMRVRSRVHEMLEHQDYPFPLLVEKVNPERDPSRPVLYNTVFNMPTPPVLEWPGLEVEMLENRKISCVADLCWNVMDFGESLHLSLEYNTDLFDNKTVRRFARSYLDVLTACLRDQEVQVRDVALVTQEERELHARLNAAEAALEEGSIPERFVRMVEAHGQSIAVSDGRTQLTYRELDARSDLAARALRSRGVGRNTRVALTMSRSVGFVIAALGVLKAGGAYVPVDPSYPQERIRYLLEDSAPVVEATDADLAAWLEEGSAGEETAGNERAGAGDAAYIIYTSGSTGKPKGVVATHIGVVNLAQAQRQVHGYDERDVFLQAASFSFDMSVHDIFSALLNGAHLRVLDEEERMSPSEFARVAREVRATVVMLSPAFFHQVALHAPDPSDLASLRRVLVAGEALQAGVVEAWRGRIGTSAVIGNAYGPTEATVYATSYEIPERVPANVPIGTPLPNVRTYVLSGDRQLSPVNVLGELYIGGIAVTKGYWNSPERTAEAFVPHPLAQGGVLYRTGDRVRLLPDGNLEFAGRTDGQVKVRGYRVEIGEIEATMLLHPLVEGAAVLTKQAVDGRTNLYGFYMGSVEAETVGAHLSAHLPRYMLPNRLFALESMPLTPSQKIDRKALAVRLEEELAAGEERREAVTLMEQKIAAIWSEALQRSGITGESNFFELGGHSLLLMQVQSRLRRTLGVSVAIGELFARPTLSQIAAYVETLVGADRERSEEEIIPTAPQQDRHPLSHTQRRVWFLSKLHPKSMLYQVPNHRLHHGALDVKIFQEAVRQLAARHEVLRTVFLEEDGEPYQVVRPAADVEITCLETDFAGVKRWVRESEQEPFDLARGPLMRVMVARIAEETHYLYLNLHHIITDGWSVDLIFTELEEIYEAAVEGRLARLAPLSARYVDYARWQRASEEEEGYWLDQMRAPLPVLHLPTDAPRPEVKTEHGALLLRELPHEWNRRLQDVCLREEVSLFMLLLSAYVLTLRQATECDDLIIGTPVSGRTHSSLEPLLGFFANTLPIRVQTAGVHTLRDLVQVVKEQCLGAFAHQSYPFDELVEKVNPVRDPSRSPIFSTMFSYQHEKKTGLFGEWSWEVGDHRIAKHDLSLMVIDGKLGWEYNTDLLTEETVQRMAVMYERALQEMAGSLAAPLDRIDLAGESIAARFAETAARCADAVAVADGTCALTYRELDEQSTRAAQALRARGVGANQLVGLLFEREVQVAVAMLGILKAGGAYVPIDPAYPQERIRHMLADSGAKWLLTSRDLREAQTFDADVLDLDSLLEEGDAGAEAFVPEAVGADLAYVIYTSGSTGQSKGVAVRQNSLVNLANWFAQEWDYSPGDVACSVTTVSFDAFVGDAFGCWLNGATLQVLGNEQRLAPSVLARAVQACGGTRMFLPTALFHLVALSLDDEQVRDLAAMKTIYFGGEVLNLDALRAWQRRMGLSVQLVHVYGPTEATVFSTFFPITELIGEEQMSVPIGRPLSGYRAYVLDEQMKPCPVHAAGELYIGGAGVAQGYLNRPELTEARFLLHEAYGRLYRTGDCVRLLPGGLLDYAARLDDQVKVRGFRVEIGEVETALLQLPAIREAAVISQQGADGNRMLVALYVAEGADVQDKHIIRSLRTFLPDYMIPSRFVRLAEMPLTLNGKLDRRELAARAGRAVAAPAVKPEAVLQQRIAGIWADVLDVDASGIGLHDSFFEIGGHSLLLNKVHVRLQEELGADIALVELFQYPTVLLLAERLAEGAEAAGQAASTERSKGAPAAEESVAIIGIGLRFPDANTPEQFWHNVRTGRESVREVPLEDLEKWPEWAAPERLIRVGGHLDDIDKFDAAFFGISEREAELTDPQHRLFLECVWEAVEDAGYNVFAIDRPVALYAGITPNEYVSQAGEFANLSDEMQAIVLSRPQFLATRTSYLLNLTGESLNLDTACSTSLVAVHHACSELLAGRADYALAGGVSVNVPHKTAYVHEPGFILSQDGYCRPFDSKSSGSAGGNGAGVVFLKRLSDAMRDGDPVYGVIRGSATNNDGHRKVGYTAPSQPGQKKVIRQAQEKAGVSPAEIAYVETHGSGTSLGDGIEFAALRDAFAGVPEGACAIGAVKASIGHTNAAAGIAGLIKTVLAVQHGEIPPLVNFERPNPALELEGSPFYFPKEAQPWPTDRAVRRAGISSFGIGGTNAHLIVEEAPAADRAANEEESSRHVFLLSARSEQALREQARRLADHLRRHPALVLGDLEYTLQVGRVHHEHRLAMVAGCAEELIDQLTAAAAGNLFSEQGDPETGVDEVSARDEEALHLGRLWAAGEEVDWQAHHRGKVRRRVHAPTYPFERKSYWLQRAQQPARVRQIEPAAVREERSTAEVVHGFWTDVLGVETIRPHDHFFEMGGSSLNLIQVQTRIQREWGLEIRMADLFHYLTFDEQVAYLNGMRGKEQEEETSRRISSYPRQAHYPLAYPQRHMWEVQKQAPQSAVYLTYNNFQLIGQLDVDAFRTAYVSLFERHAALRTTFLEVDGEPRQLVQDKVEPLFLVEDWSGEPDGIRERLAADRKRPFDLEEGPLAWALLVRESGDSFHFQYTQHHLITDGWSLNLFMKELMSLYESHVRGIPSQLPPLRLEYADYVMHNLESWDERGERYWQETLGEALPSLDLPTDCPRPAVQTYRGAYFDFDIPLDVVQGAWRAAMREDASRVMVVFAAYALLLRRLTGSEDLTIALPMAGRTERELEAVVGCLAAPVPIRLQLEGVQSLSDILQLVKHGMLEGMAHQGSFRHRGLHESSISTMFNFGALHEQQGQEYAGVRVEACPFSFDLETSKYDLSFHVLALDDASLRVSLEYSTDLFRKDTVAGMAELYLQGLRAFGESLRAPLDALSILALR